MIKISTKNLVLKENEAGDSTHASFWRKPRQLQG